ncbi:MAG TPA: hypothetical protein VNS58_20815 [Puia sp.]|nr:hypothetical protein [Puia sp.]
MDKKVLIRSLKKLFCDLNQVGKRYSEVWISDVDFGGLYHSDQYILHLRAAHPIRSRFKETAWIIKFLDEHAHEESKFIWRVQVHAADDKMYDAEDGILVYDEETLYK